MFDSRECTIKKVKWDCEDAVLFETDHGCWQGAKRKDFWNPDRNWEKEIKAGTLMRLWTVQWSTVLGFEVFLKGEWISVWCHANDFQTKAERKKSSEGYVNFIEEEGKKIAGFIDDGKTLAEIDKLISNDHSGNTYGWALNLGIKGAKNLEKAEKIRVAHNKVYGVSEDKKGVVNPAVLTIG